MVKKVKIQTIDKIKENDIQECYEFFIKNVDKDYLKNLDYEEYIDYIKYYNKYDDSNDYNTAEYKIITLENLENANIKDKDLLYLNYKDKPFDYSEEFYSTSLTNLQEEYQIKNVMKIIEKLKKYDDITSLADDYIDFKKKEKEKERIIKIKKLEQEKMNEIKELKKKVKDLEKKLTSLTQKIR